MRSRLPALLLPAAVCAAADAPDAVRLSQEGLELYQAKRFSEALVRFEAALTLEPGNATLRSNVAEASAALGQEATAAERWDEAAKRFRRSLELKPEARFALWLATAQEREGDPAAAEASYRKALELAPDDAKPKAALGRLLFSQDRLGEAAQLLEAALKAAPGDASLEKLLGQCRRDRDFEKGLSETGVSQFEIAFDGATNAEASQRILGFLLDAQTEAANDLGLRQRARIRVVLYTSKEYASVTLAPEWAAAHYDGKIRVPVRDLDRREREVRATLYHEYVHALLGQNAPKCPSWLHEGLAQAVEYGRVLGSDAEGLRLRALEGAEIPSLRDLEAPIASLPAARVTVAYATSLAFVRYLESRFGASAMQVCLSRMSERPDRPYREAFREAFGSDLEDLERDWRESRR